MRAVESFVAGTWVAGSGGRPVHDAVTGEMIASVSSDGVDLGAAHAYARDIAGPALRRLTFHDRAAILRALGKALLTQEVADALDRVLVAFDEVLVPDSQNLVVTVERQPGLHVGHVPIHRHPELAGALRVS